MKEADHDQTQSGRLGGKVLLLDKEQFDWLLREFDIQNMRPHRKRFFDHAA